MRADLHIHTNASDGTYNSYEIVQMTKQKGIEFAAIADHDSAANIKSFVMACKQEDIVPACAVEFSVSYHKDLHILAYFVDIDNEKLHEKLLSLEKDRQDRAHRIINMLNKKGYKLSIDDIEEKNITNALGRAHIAKAMVKKGYAENIDQAFKQHLSREMVMDVERDRMDAKTCIEMILKAGGISVLAHPVFMRDDQFEHYLDELISYGLNGIEAYCPDHSDDDAEYFEKLAIDKGLIVTCGSDFHGTNKPEIELGHEQRSSEYLEFCKELLYNKAKERCM